jgi:O-antigen/teichoic acid export membrane protein
MAGTVASSGLGFVFWMLAARSTSAADIGIATAAIASINLLIALCDLGLGTTLIHYASAEWAQAIILINTMIATGWLCIGVAAIGFLGGVPLWSPGLMPIRGDVALVIVFFAFAAFNHILGLQDAAMLSQGQASYIFWRNLACNIPSVVLVWPLVHLIGKYHALFLAYSLPNIIVGLIAGIVILPRYFKGYRFFGRIDRDILTKTAPYGLANYTSNILWGLPAFLLPIIAINTLSAENTGYFVINWTIANFVLIAPRMVTYSLFAEGSRSNKDLLSSSIHSFTLILVLVAPVILFLWFRGDYVLGLFGQGYINISLLRLLLMSIVPFAINSIYFVILRVRRRLKQIILFSALTAASVLTLAGVFVYVMGAEGIAMGWLLGHTIPTIVVSAIAVRTLLINRPATT